MLYSLISPDLLVGALLIAGFAGLIKGVVGFAMPTVLITGLGSLVSPELALAGLILPTLVTNGMQALRQGWRAAWASMKRFRRFLLAGLVTLLTSAQIVTALPVQAMLAAIGLTVTFFALLQLSGRSMFGRMRPGPRAEMAVGGFAGFIGGMSGIWGPPTVAFLTALDVEKREHVRVQGVIYGLGAVALFAGHVASGVMNAQTVWFSAALIPPAVLGMWLGGKVQDRIDQALFRKVTLLVLILAGLNLLRRALIG